MPPAERKRDSPVVRPATRRRRLVASVAHWIGVDGDVRQPPRRGSGLRPTG
jgi:hypothetical protein